MTVKAVESLALLKMRREAYKLYPAVQAMIEVNGSVVPFHCDRLLHTAAGIAAAAGRRWEKAEQHFNESMRQADELPHRLEQPEVRRFYAQMLLERDAPGDRARAHELLNEAVAIYRQLGMPKHAEMTEGLLAGASVSS
jgi:hypothetical protein